MAYLLSYNGSVEILRAHLSEAVGVESAYLLTGLPSPAPDQAAYNTPVPTHTDAHALGTRAAASQAWVVSGDRTVTGKPLLASDPHLPLSIPSIWYEIHLAGGGLNVAGASIPGIPLVLIGRNERIAWGITASFADVQDHYVVTRNPENPRQYAFGEEWIDFDVYTETIPVANGAPVPLETLRTRYGVVVSDGPQEDRVLALRWDSLWSGDNAYASLLLNQATNWPEFTEALGWLGAVPLSFVYADVDGNIGFFPSGEIPVRSGFDGTVPVDGQSDAYEWLGVVPHEMKPFFFNPEEGYIVSANHKMIADFHPNAPTGSSRY
jgi:penicillin amidase